MVPAALKKSECCANSPSLSTKTRFKRVAAKERIVYATKTHTQTIVF